jgi:hypothetical protein
LKEGTRVEVRGNSVSSFLFGHPPKIYVAAAATLVVLFGVLGLGNKAIDTAHRLIDLLREWREYRRGN